MAGPVLDADIKTLVASALKVASEQSLPPYWDLIITQANDTAWRDIQDRLTSRGFSQAQITGWDRVLEFNRDIALYWALVKGAALEHYADDWVKKIDRRAELATVLLTCNGIWQVPGGGVQVSEATNPPVAVGPQTSAKDLFAIDDTDPRAGTITQW